MLKESKKRPSKNAKKSNPAVVTKADVARAAGVSHITVSRVINTPEKVAPETRERVEAFIASMDYIPNLLAGGLSSKRTGVITAIVPTIGHSIFAESILRDALGDANTALVAVQDYTLLNTPGPSKVRSALSAAVETMTAEFRLRRITKETLANYI